MLQIKRALTSTITGTNSMSSGQLQGDLSEENLNKALDNTSTNPSILVFRVNCNIANCGLAKRRTHIISSWDNYVKKPVIRFQLLHNAQGSISVYLFQAWASPAMFCETQDIYGRALLKRWKHVSCISWWLQDCSVTQLLIIPTTWDINCFQIANSKLIIMRLLTSENSNR